MWAVNSILLLFFIFLLFLLLFLLLLLFPPLLTISLPSHFLLPHYPSYLPFLSCPHHTLTPLPPTL